MVELAGEAAGKRRKKYILEKTDLESFRSEIIKSTR